MALTLSHGQADEVRGFSVNEFAAELKTLKCQEKLLLASTEISNYKELSVRKTYKRWLTVPENDIPLQTLTHLSTEQQDILIETTHNIDKHQSGISNVSTEPDNEEENIAWMSSLH